MQVVFSEKKAKNTEKKQIMYSWGDSGAGDLRLQAVPADPGLTEVSCGAIAAAEAPYEAAPPFPTAAQAGETTGALPACAGLLSSRWALCHLQSLLRDLLEFELDGEASLLPSLLLAVVPHGDAAAASQGATRPRCQVVSPPSVSRGRSSLDLGWLWLMVKLYPYSIDQAAS